MKKIFIAAVAAACVSAAMTSCGGPTPKASLKTDVDTLSYAMGMANSQGLKGYLVDRVGIDTAYMDEFYKGLKEGTDAGDDKAKEAYFAGVMIGQQISNQMIKGIEHELFGNDSTRHLSKKNFLSGFISGVQEGKGKMTLEQAQQLSQIKMQQIRSKNMEKQYGANKAAGEKFLAENAKKEGVKTLPGGVQYRIIKEGKGAIPTDTTRVKVHYEGKTLDGKVFDSSYKRNDPVTLRANQLVKGFSEALTHMPAGSVWEVWIPQEKAYGDRKQGTIDPFSCLNFKIELLEVN